MTEEQSRREVSPSVLVKSEPSDSPICAHISRRCGTLCEITHLGNNAHLPLKAPGRRQTGALTIGRSKLLQPLLPRRWSKGRCKAPPRNVPATKYNLNPMIKPPDPMPTVQEFREPGKHVKQDIMRL